MSPEIFCTNCVAACCKGPLVINLSAEEHAMMSAVGNELITVAEPVDYDRDEVIYPVGLQINKDRNTRKFLAENGREYEPLAAGLGRYVLMGTCKNLTTSPFGLEICSVYDERPQVCKSFKMGGEDCQLLRILRKVDVS